MVSPTGTAADVSGAWRFLPGLYRLRHYERGWLRPDLLAGTGVAAYLIPQVMAYAEVAGLPADRRPVGDQRRAAVLRTARLVAAALGRARSRRRR